ncbi:MAG: hypothetical protein R3C11_05980 [Planctomycetaceae bacterium]
MVVRCIVGFVEDDDVVIEILPVESDQLLGQLFFEVRKNGGRNFSRYQLGSQLDQQQRLNEIRQVDVAQLRESASLH